MNSSVHSIDAGSGGWTERDQVSCWEMVLSARSTQIQSDAPNLLPVSAADAHRHYQLNRQMIAVFSRPHNPF